MIATGKPGLFFWPAGRWQRMLMVVGLAFVLLLIGVSCALRSAAMPGDAGGLERCSYIANTSAGAFTVSYLIAERADAPRVIFVHGTPGDATNFRRYVATPIEGVEVISVDRPGFGATTPGGPEPSFAIQAAALEPLLVARRGADGRPQWPILVGHSLGGPIAAWAAAEWPDRVGGLVILAGSFDPALEEPAWFNHLADSAVVKWTLSEALRHSNDEIMAARAETEALESRLGRVRCPVVWLHGRKDTLVPFANVEFARMRLTDVASWKLIDWPDEGHFIPWTREADVRAAIRSLAGTEPARD